MHQVLDQSQDEPESMESFRRNWKGPGYVEGQCKEGVPPSLPLFILPVLWQHLASMDPRWKFDVLWFFASWFLDNFELDGDLVHSEVSKMIINEELKASWDEPTNSLVLHQTEPTRLQNLALQLSQRLNNLTENNERLCESKQGSNFSAFYSSKSTGHKQRLTNWLAHNGIFWSRFLPDFFLEYLISSEAILSGKIWRNLVMKSDLILVEKSPKFQT